MKTSHYDFGIRDYSYRKPTCKEDMQGMLDNIDSQYLYQYDAVLMALFSCAEDFALSQQIIYEITTLRLYLNYIFGVLFTFPQLSHYRPMLLFYIIEMDKCVAIYHGRMALYETMPSLTTHFLSDTWSEHEVYIKSQIKELHDDFLNFKSELSDLMVNEENFRDDGLIDEFVHELSDIDLLLVRCDSLHDQCVDYWINSPLLSYISAILLWYAFVCRSSFLHGLVWSKSPDEYVWFLKKSTFILSMQSFYGDRWESLSSDFDPDRYYYFRSTHPSISSYKYHYLSASDQDSESIEQTNMKVCYVGIDPDTGNLDVIGTTKEDFELMAYLEEEITMPVVCLWLDPSMIDILSSSEDHPDKQEIKKLIQDTNIILTLTTQLDKEKWFIVSLTDSDGSLADTFVFTRSELQKLQSSSD